MKESFVPTGVIDRAALKALSLRSDAKGAARLLQHAAALVGSGALVAWTHGTLWLPPALWLHGTLLVFLFAPQHETIHRTAFRSRPLNDEVAWAAGALLILPPGYFRAFHFAHHRFTQDPARDPELALAKPRDLKSYLWVASGLPYWGERLATTVKHALGRVDQPFITQGQEAAIRLDARRLLAVYAAIAVLSVVLESAAVLTYWIVPALLGQPALRLYLMAEHTGCPLVADMLDNSRTTRSTAALRWLAWNMPFHAEHHAYPALPFHALPGAHALLAPRIAVQSSGYLSLHAEILRGLAPEPRKPGPRAAGPRIS